tara:strand:- start:1416 stop:1559 length:144 start_codon:yes stop_codon:yes gene_type:complete
MPLLHGGEIGSIPIGSNIWGGLPSWSSGRIVHLGCTDPGSIPGDGHI